MQSLDLRKHRFPVSLVSLSFSLTLCAAFVGCSDDENGRAPNDEGDTSARTDESQYGSKDASADAKSHANKDASAAGGATIWLSQFGTAEGDEAKAIALDPSGDVIVVGTVVGALPGQTGAATRNVYVRKLRAGAEIWTRQIGGAQPTEVGAVTVDGNGNVFVAAWSTNALAGSPILGSADVFIRKYDANGKELWTKTLGTKKFENALAIELDASGNVYVGGTTEGTFVGQTFVGGTMDAYVSKLDSTGNVLWTHEFGTVELDAIVGISVDASENVFLAGWTSGALPGQVNAYPSFAYKDVFLRKLDSAGAPQWTRQLGTKYSDVTSALASDAAGNLYVTGTTDGDLGGIKAVSSKHEAFILKFDATGARLWGRQVSVESQADALAVDANGNSFIAGRVDEALPGLTAFGDFDTFVRSYSASGVQQKSWQFGSERGDWARGIAVAGKTIAVAGDADGEMPTQKSAGLRDAWVASWTN